MFLPLEMQSRSLPKQSCQPQVLTSIEMVKWNNRRCRSRRSLPKKENSSSLSSLRKPCTPSSSSSRKRPNGSELRSPLRPSLSVGNGEMEYYALGSLCSIRKGLTQNLFSWNRTITCTLFFSPFFFSAYF